MDSIELKDLRSFSLVARSGSITAAAKSTEIPKATISYQVRRLEEHLETDLFSRKGKYLELTGAGKQLLNYADMVLATMAEAKEVIQHDQDRLAGRLAIGVANEFGTTLIGPILQRFAHNYQSLEVEVDVLPNHNMRTDRSDLDCIIYTGTPPNSDLIQKKVWSFRYKLYGGTKYLEHFGHPKRIDDLKFHQCISYLENFAPKIEKFWSLTNGDETLTYQPNSKISSSDFWMTKYFALSNLGITYLPEFFVMHEVTMGALEPVLPDYQSEEIPVYAFFPKYRFGNRKVIEFLDLWAKNIDTIGKSLPYTLVDVDTVS